MSAELILHHYTTSPFSEKVRLVLGAKDLAWRSVHIPVVMPKPDVLALTGGYRRTPFLQIGADIYCDSMLICQLLDRLQPEPSLFPPEGAGLAQMLAQWADSKLFWSAVPYALQPRGAAAVFADVDPVVAQAFAADRAAFTAGMRRPTLADATVALHSQLGWLEMHLGDERRHLAGSALSVADFAVAHCLWFVHRVPPVAGILQRYPRVLAWLERTLAVGHGHASLMDSDEAIAVAAGATAHAPVEVSGGQGFEPGDAVTVAATDYGLDPTPGRLVGLGLDSVTIERRDPRAGLVHVHFPRLGFQIKKEKVPS